MTAPCKADVLAADRVLKAAVRKAREQIASGQLGEFNVWRRGVLIRRAYDRRPLVDMLTAAGIAADLLLEER